jgi:hypothetical protein
MLAFSGWVGEDGNRVFKHHYHVYYVYHAAAISHLAHGEIGLYLRYVNLAQSELDAMKKIVDRSKEKAGKEGGGFYLPRPRPPQPLKPTPDSPGDPT